MCYSAFLQCGRRPKKITVKEAYFKDFHPRSHGPIVPESEAEHCGEKHVTEHRSLPHNSWQPQSRDKWVWTKYTLQATPAATYFLQPGLTAQQPTKPQSH